MADKPIKDPCEEYGLAITNFVIGEKMNMTKEKLFEHLRQCQKCQNDLRNWKATHSAMRATAIDSSPDGKTRKQVDFAKVKEAVNAQYVPSMPDAISIEKIGTAAGTMWKCIGANGPIPITVLPEKCNLDSWTATATFGWLLGEKKLKVDDKRRPNIVSLTPKEQNIYFKETGQIERI